MIYREAGQFKTSYASDQAIFPIVQDRWVAGLVLVAAVLVPPLVANDYWLQAILIPFLVYALAAIGLNLLTGYAGQLSLGTGGFMAVGAYSAFKLTTAFPRVSILLVFLASGVIAAAVGLLFGLPSLRIKGFYLAVATLAAQFFLIWLFNKVGWFVNYASSGTITAPNRTVLGVLVTGPNAGAPARYLMALGFVDCVRARRQEPRAGPDRPVLDGHPGPGHRGRDHRRAAAPDEAARLRHQLVLLRGGRSRASVPVSRAARRRWPSTSTSRSWSSS